MSHEIYYVVQKGNLLIYKCLKCHKLHSHGASYQNFKVGESAGFRVSHCLKHRSYDEIELVVIQNLNEVLI